MARGKDDYSPLPSAEVKTAILPVHYTPSWNAQRKLYFYFTSVLTVCTYEWAGGEMFIVLYSKVKGIKIVVDLIY